MSIVHSGPAGWEFQYVATALIGLELLAEDNNTLWVEPINGEDAKLSLKTGKLVVEVQAKSSQTDLDSAILADYLAHFPDRSASDNLLARLAQDQNRVALFIVGARCGDATRGLLAKPGEIRPHAIAPLNPAHLTALVEAFEKVYHSKTPSNLERDRDKFCQNLAANLRADRTAAMNMVQRVVVWEQLEKNGLELKLEDELFRKYSVPRTQVRNARLACVEAVRLAREEQIDLIPKLRNVVAGFAGVRILLEPYLQRGCEVALLAELKSRRVLFLTGQSKCGKSQTARFLAEECRKTGISCEIGSIVPEAVRYLNAVGEDDRLFFLDDPFGHLTLNATAAEDLSRLRNLLTSLPPHRFLIVTSRIDIVSAVDAKAPSPGFAWHDLTVKDSAFLTGFWTSMCVGKGLSPKAFNTVLHSLTLMDQNELLQPGQLRHLASSTETVHESDFSALCSLAKCNSVDLANSFLSKGGATQQLHAALALGATVIQALPVRCLEYILSADISQPGIHVKDLIEAIPLGYDGPPPPFPAEPKVAAVSSVQSDELSLLEKRGFIQFSKNEITFAHPDYFEASTSVLLRMPAIRFGELIGIATRAVTGLSPAIAKNALRQFPRLYKTYTDAEQRRAIAELAFLALNSIFPSVRDLALTILVSWLDELKKDDQERVLNLIQRTDLRFDDILWHDGTPWLNPTPRTSAERLFGWDSTQGEQAIEPDLVIRLLDQTRRNPLSVYEAWVLVSALKHKSGHEISYPALKALMRYEEGFIRADAAFLLCANLPSYDEDAVSLALNDDHPAVAFEGVLGCFTAWETFAPGLKSALLKNIRGIFERIAIAACANRFVIDFGDSENMGSFKWGKAYQNKSPENWLLWADIAPVFLRTVLKHSVWINESNFWHTTKQACKHLSPEVGLALCQAWLDWIEARLKHALPDDYGLALAEFLVEVTEGKPTIRLELSTKLLNHSDTAFLLSSVREYISHWSDLTESEHAMLLALFESDRKDRRWIRALAITRPNPPSKVVEKITGKKSLSSLSAHDVISLLPNELLEDCLHIYTGRHPIFYYLGFSFSAHEPWLQILEYSVERPSSTHFELGLRQMLSSSLNGIHNWPNAYRTWTKLCDTADKSLRERLFHELLTWTIRINSNGSAIFWRVFLNRVKAQDELDNYLCRIIDVVEAVESSTGDLADLADTFGHERFYEKMLHKLPIDTCVLEILSASKRFKDRAVQTGLLDLLKAIYEKVPPRLRQVHELVAKYNGNESADFEALVEELREQGIKTSSNQFKEFDDVDSGLPPGWNSWRKDREVT